MSGYARNTSVPVDRSKAEIERTLARYGAEKFGYLVDRGESVIGFEVRGRAVRMRLSMPEKPPASSGRAARGARAAEVKHERAVRQRWRALALVVKAKLEAIESGIATFDDEWLAYLVTKSGTTVGEQVLPQLLMRNGSEPLMLTDKPRRG